MSYLLTQTLVRDAVAMVGPSILEVLKLSERIPSGHLVVRCGDRMLFEQSFGAVSEEDDFKKIARSKAEIAEREKSTTREIMINAPWRYQTGDAPFPGGVFLEGIAVGFSGVENQYDEMFAWWAVHAIDASCRIAMLDLPPGSDFIGAPPAA